MAQDIVAALEAEIAELEAELSADVRFVRLQQLRKTLSLYVDPDAIAAEMRSLGARVIDPGAVQTVQRPHRDIKPNNLRHAGRRAAHEKIKALEAVALHLANRSGPVPTRELLDHLNDLGVEIGGASPLNNLSAMLSNSEGFVSVGRAGWVLSNAEAAARKAEEEEEEEDEPSTVGIDSEIYKKLSIEYLDEQTADAIKGISDHLEFNGELPDEVKDDLVSRFKNQAGQEYEINSGKFHRAFVSELEYYVKRILEMERSVADFV